MRRLANESAFGRQVFFHRSFINYSYVKRVRALRINVVFLFIFNGFNYAFWQVKEKNERGIREALDYQDSRSAIVRRSEFVVPFAALRRPVSVFCPLHPPTLLLGTKNLRRTPNSGGNHKKYLICFIMNPPHCGGLKF